MHIFEAYGTLDNENYGEFIVVDVDVPLVAWNQGVEEWDKKIRNQLQDYYTGDPDEEDNNKHWVRYEYDSIILYIVRQISFNQNHPMDISGYYNLGITEANNLHYALKVLEDSGNYELIRNMLSVVIEHVLSNSNGVRVF